MNGVRDAIEWAWSSTVNEPTSVEIGLDDLLTICEALDQGGLVVVLGSPDATWFAAHWFARLHPQRRLTVVARGSEPIRSLPNGSTMVLIDAAVEALDASEGALASSGLPSIPDVEVHAVVSAYGPRRFAAKVVVQKVNGNSLAV